MALRPVVQGLYNRQGWPSSATARGLISGFISEPGWNQLQGAQDGSILHPNPIDEDLALLRANWPGAKMKVRVGRAGGFDHATWLRTLCGEFPMYESRDNRFPAPTQIVRWWVDAYVQAYTVLMEKLALEYDNEVDFPEIIEFTFSQGRTFYMEPFIRQIAAKNADGTSINAEAILNAGYTPTLNNNSMYDSIPAHDAFKSIRTSIAISPTQYYDPSTRKGAGEVFNNSSHSVVFGRKMRKILGRRAVLGNNAYTAPLKSPAALYTFLEDMGAPLYYQTENPKEISGQLKATRTQSMDSSRNNMIELPGTYPWGSLIKNADGSFGPGEDPNDTLTDSEVTTWDDDITTNPTETAPGIPGNFNVVVNSSTQVTCSWVYPTGLGIIEIRIYKDGVLAKTVQTYPNDKKTSVILTEQPAGTNVWTARSYNMEESADSNAVTKTLSGGGGGTDTQAPTAPVITSAAQNDVGVVPIVWNASTDNSGTITRYGIERDGVEIGTTTALTFTDNNPIPRSTHVYVVRAYDPAGLNTPSAGKSVVIRAAVEPEVVTGWTKGRRRRWKNR